MRHEHTSLGLELEIKDGITTRDLEKWMRGLRTALKGERVSPFEDNVATLKAAIDAGVIVAPKLIAAQVGDLPPAHTRWYASKLDELYRELTTIPLA